MSDCLRVAFFDLLLPLGTNLSFLQELFYDMSGLIQRVCVCVCVFSSLFINHDSRVLQTAYRLFRVCSEKIKKREREGEKEKKNTLYLHRGVSCVQLDMRNNLPQRRVKINERARSSFSPLTSVRARRERDEAT